MQETGKCLIVISLLMFMCGLLLAYTSIGQWLGKLPGDLSFKGENWQVHIPLASSILLSVLLSLAMWLFQKR